MKTSRYHISNITPLSSIGELKVVLSSQSRMPEACSLVMESEGLSEERCSFEANYHPFSSDIRLQVTWKAKNEERCRFISISANEQDQIIAAISDSCRSEYGLSPMELIESARKEDERVLLRQYFSNICV